MHDGIVDTLVSGCARHSPNHRPRMRPATARRKDDVLRRVHDRFGALIFAYLVSGEYSMIMAAVRNGWLDHRKRRGGDTLRRGAFA